MGSSLQAGPRGPGKVSCTTENETVGMIGFGKSRVESLSDCIFAFSMTLLVITIEVPAFNPGMTESGLAALLISRIPDLVHYVIAFLVIAVIWVIHHVQFQKFRVVDHTLLWMNIISLLFIALLPFSTDLAGDFPTFTLPAMIFEANLLVPGVIFYLEWEYATGNHRLIESSVSENTVRFGRYLALVIPAISAIAFVIAAAGITGSILVYILAPFVFLILYYYQGTSRPVSRE